MSAITQFKPTTVHRTSKNSETKAPKAKSDEAVKSLAKEKQQDCPQPDEATNRSADGINADNRSVENCPQESEKGAALKSQPASEPVMVQPADLWRKNCSKPHRI